MKFSCHLPGSDKEGCGYPCCVGKGAIGKVFIVIAVKNNSREPVIAVKGSLS
jgi:hypothetical protein